MKPKEFHDEKRKKSRLLDERREKEMIRQRNQRRKPWRREHQEIKCQGKSQSNQTDDDASIFLR